MKPPVAAFPILPQAVAAAHGTAAARWGTMAACALMLAGCASQPPLSAGRSAGDGRYFDPILGVWASPRLVDEGQPVPRGGGGYLVGRPYTIGGHTFMPNANPQGYAAVGTASWYGDAFQGRRTANGEIFDKGAISAAHPTLPLPSYVRVTNLTNGRSIIVRVNDRGPYHGGRVMDVSQRVAEALAFKSEGTGHVRIEYVGRASLAGSDNGRLQASLTTDGRPARLDGMAAPVQVADEALPPPPDGPSPLPNVPARVAALPIFRRGHAVTAPTIAAVPSNTMPPPAPPPFPTPVALSARPVLVSTRRTAPTAGRDPYFHPLFPAPRAEPRAAISFSSSARRDDAPKRPAPARRGTEAPADEAQ